MKLNMMKSEDFQRKSVSIFVALLIANFKVIDGFTVGVPPLRSVCINMNPQHHDYVAQGSDPPYVISVNRNKVDGGDVVEVSLNSIQSETKTKFIGFYIQARDENDSPIGTFTPNKDTKVHSCGGIRANGAHHANGGVKKENVTISWTAPREFQGEVVFTATALQNFVTYWVYLQTEPVNVIKTAAPAQEILSLGRRPSLSSVSSASQTQSQPPRGNGIRMIFQNLQNAANRLGAIFTAPPRLLRNNNNSNNNGTSNNNNFLNDNSVSGTSVSLSSSSNADNQSRRTCNFLFFKRIFCNLFQN